MATDTSIEWADKTWSPIIGCDRVSPGCDSCYAITTAHIRKSNPHPDIAAAFAGTTHKNDGRVDWTGQINHLEDRLAEPLSKAWQKPLKIFVNSQSDLFHKDVDTAFIAKVFAIMALTPQHQYQILTKRHARMRSVLTDTCTCGNGHAPGVHFRSAMAWAVSKANPDRIPGVPDDAEQRVNASPWPLPGVWMGVSVENQHWADIRIPALLQTPAAVRFLSCEPLLGPIDLTKHLGGAHGVEEPRGRRVLGGSGRRVDHRQSGADLESGCAQERPLERGNEDDSLQAQASGARHGDVLSGPRHEGPGPLLRAGAQAGMAALHGADTAGPDGEPQERQQAGQPSGEPGTGDSLGASSARPASIEAGPPGSVRDAQLDGEADTRRGSADQAQAVSWRDAGVDRRGLSDQDAARLAHREGHASISWVICGGESGPKARPMHPDWARGLRNQCALAGVPYLFKQWGTWGVDSPLDDQGRLLTTRRGLGVTVANDGTVYQPGDLAYPDGPRYGEAVRAGHDKAHLTAMYRLGKKEAGRELDGRTHDAFPAVTA